MARRFHIAGLGGCLLRVLVFNSGHDSIVENFAGASALESVCAGIVASGAGVARYPIPPPCARGGDAGAGAGHVLSSRAGMSPTAPGVWRQIGRAATRAGG